jgi:hypothetical protein
MSFVIIDRSKHGPEAVLMIVEDRTEAEEIAFELRRHRGVAAAIVEFEPETGPGPVPPEED